LQGSTIAVAAVAVAALPASGGVFAPAETSLVSVSSQLAQGDASSGGGTVSAGGRYVAFLSSAGNLVPGDANRTTDVFVRDRLAGTTRRTSLAPNGSEVVGDYFDLHLSHAGTRLGFVSTAPLAPGANGRNHAFVQDLGGATRLVSRSTGGAVENGATVGAALSGDGRFVAFASSATNLVPGDTNGEIDIFVRDLRSSTTVRVSVGRNGAQANWFSVDPAISRDGRFVAFASAASNLVADDTNGQVDVFVRDLATGRTTLLSRAPDGGPADLGGGEPSISGNGTRVLFHSVATNLVRGDTNGTRDVFVRDLAVAVNRLVSVGPGGRLGDGPSFAGDLSADGRHATFDSRATNLVDGDTNGQDDLFARDEPGDG
jgi:Tol biopolymer transport system component